MQLVDGVLLALVQATMAGMRVVKAAQGKQVFDAEAKADGTYVTAADKASEEAAMPYLLRTGFDIFAEEAGHSGEYKTKEVAVFDPLDGTRIFLLGGSSATVIAATYDRMNKVVTRVVVGEAATGRVWWAALGKGTWVFSLPDFVEDDDVVVLEALIAGATRCLVWDEVVAKKSTIFLDLTPTFQKAGYRVIEKENLADFFASVFRRYDVSLPGSNGLHHALVANGGIGAKAAVTTALGFPGDVVAVLLVLEAGGAARAFADGKEVSPTAVTDYNILVTGNSQSVVDELSELLLETCYM